MKVVDLKRDLKLLKVTFDGYKLSLEPIPNLKLENIPKPDDIAADLASEYSFLHSSLYQLHNHLIADPWLSNTAYYIDSWLNIHKIVYEYNTGKLKPLFSVFRCLNRRPELDSAGIYNSDFKFISEKLAVLSDGIGNLRILDTGDRQSNDEWKSVQVFQPLEGKGFIVKDTKLKIENEEKLIHTLLLHIEIIDGKFHNVITWITLKQGVGSWEESARKIIQGKGNLYYLSLDPKCKSIVYSTNQQYIFTHDNVNEIVEELPVEVSIRNLQVEESESQDFNWIQSREEIAISFKRTAEATIDHYHVNCLKNHIEVKYQSHVLMDSDIFAEVDTNKLIWSLEDEFFQLKLAKTEAGINWPYLIPGGPSMETGSGQGQLLNAPVSDFNTQMEECDHGRNGQSDEEFFLERLDGTTHKSSHKVFLGSNNPLFSTTLRPGFPQAVAIRNDVDCCLWLQQVSPTNDEWALRHEGTLHAFGYIQASKREGKYLACSPDTKTAVICESSRHLFLYKDTYSTASGLRKRSGPAITLGQQKVVTFDSSSGKVLGISVENELIFILLENSVCCLQFSIEE